MTSTATQSPPDLRNVLYEFTLEYPSPDAAALDAVIRRHPQYAADLTEFAIELAVDALLRPSDAQVDAAAMDDGASIDVDLAMSRFHNRLYSVRHAGRPTGGTRAVATPNPFVALDRPALRALTTRLHANSVFVMKLRDRQIEPAHMSEGFRRELEDEMSVPMDVLMAHFVAQPQVQPHVRFKSDDKPQVTAKQTFDEAVRSSGLSPEQQAYLLAL